MNIIQQVNQAIAGQDQLSYTGKVVCVGRNYAAHARELNHEVPKEPLLFMKSANTVVNFDQPIQVSSLPYDVHYELEMALLIGKSMKNIDATGAQAAIDGIGLALDLTLRDLQQHLKNQGHPWEIAKSFDNSCPMTPFLDFHAFDNPTLDFTLTINENRRQHGLRSEMLFDFAELLAYASTHFTLCPGDIVLTGTPAGVGKLNPGDHLKACLATTPMGQTVVV